jgi:TatD DNase family protein
MIDIGVNLTSARFEQDRAELLARAQCAGLQHLLVTGTNIEHSLQALALCQSMPTFLSCTAGVHPHDAAQVSDNYLQQITQMANNSQVKAIGECGLDFNRNFSSQEQQITVFTAQIALAQQLQLPLFLHQRDAFDTWLSLLKPYLGTIPAMVSHCFTGTEQQLADCLHADMYIGITGWICDERRGQALYAMAKHIPLNRLLIETDAPYLLPRTIKPKPKHNRNEPSYLPYVVKTLAAAMQVSEQTIITHSRANACRVFNLPLSPVLNG